MAKSEERHIAYQDDVFCLQVTIETEGWSSLKPVPSLSSSRSSRTHLPHPSLPLSCVVTTAERDASNNVNSKISRPTFDLSLGFSHLSQATDCRPIEIAKELLHGNHICSDEVWIGYRPKDSGEDEEDCYIHSFDEAGYHPASHISDGQDLLKELDDLEAARPKPEKRQAMIPGNREGIWKNPKLGASQLHFDSWVEEIAALEASASMPKGTRYYKVKDVSK